MSKELHWVHNSAWPQTNVEKRSKIPNEGPGYGLGKRESEIGKFTNNKDFVAYIPLYHNKYRSLNMLGNI